MHFHRNVSTFMFLKIAQTVCNREFFHSTLLSTDNEISSFVFSYIIKTDYKTRTDSIYHIHLYFNVLAVINLRKMANLSIVI